MDISNQRIKDWRAVLGISIEEFSKATGIPVDRIKKIEKGAVKVNVDEITKIADTYDLTIDYLIGKRNIPLPPARTEKEARRWSQIEA